MSIQAGARLVQISSSGTAAQRLRQAAGLVGPATAAALLVAWSGLASATAAEHLLHERVAAQPGQVGGGGARAWTEEEHRAAVEAKWEAIEGSRAKSGRLVPEVLPAASPAAPVVVDRQVLPPRAVAAPAPTAAPPSVAAGDIPPPPVLELEPSLALLLASVAAEPGPQTTGAVSDEDIALILLAIAAADPSTAA